MPDHSFVSQKPDRLTPARLEAFSDGVIAVIITIMVLEFHVPGKEITNLDALRQAIPLVLVYLLSFIQTGIYWVNHHYLVDDLDQVTHGILWSNLAVLFSLSLIPAATNWVQSAAFRPSPSLYMGPSAPSQASPGWSSPPSSNASVISPPPAASLSRLLRFAST
jgi:uncharacterized membrane protein